jgi:hypothetical protein
VVEQRFRFADFGFPILSQFVSVGLKFVDLGFLLFRILLFRSLSLVASAFRAASFPDSHSDWVDSPK